jgi:hypothetical protein
VANAGYIACVGQHRECGGGVYVQIQQQAIFAVYYDGGKVRGGVLQADDSGPQCLLDFRLAQME